MSGPANSRRSGADGREPHARSSASVPATQSVVPRSCGRVSAIVVLAAAAVALCRAGIGHALGQRLIAASAKGDQGDVRRLLALGANANERELVPVPVRLAWLERTRLWRVIYAPQRCGETALIKAASAGRVDVARTLLDAGADPDLPTDPSQDPRAYYNTRPLVCAVRRGHARVVQLLLERGAPVNAGAGGDGTVLMEAMVRHDAATTECLLRGGADVNAGRCRGGTALMQAAGSGQVAGVRALLLHGARVDQTDADGRTALMFAVEQHPDAVRALVAAGADVNRRNQAGECPIGIAAREGRRDIVTILRRAGAREVPGMWRQPPPNYGG
jgi:hypothetical protein